MADRLPVDANVLGYWGLDETLETDVAFDESANAANLTVTSSPSVALGRIGNARQFDGSATFASPVGSSASFRLLGDLTAIVWAKIDNYNSGGSLLRTIFSCGGPTTGDGLLYSLSVDSSGRLVYKHLAGGGMVVVRTAVATIRTGQIYSISVRRVTTAGTQVIEFYVDNVLRPVADVTVNGAGSSLPVPPPIANASAIFSLGRSQRESDSAFWQGTLDEISFHNIARKYQPYLREAFYRISLSNDLSRITYFNNIQTISSYEMGGGVRWWCFERDKDLYVVKESPFGNFLPEVRLTTVGGSSASLTGKPELIYDPTSDTLLVLFSAGNRIFKLTAQSTDDAATINMPFTADTGGIIKSVDNVEGGRFGQGGGVENNPQGITYVNRQPLKQNFDEGLKAFAQGGGDVPLASNRSNAPEIAFLAHPTLGFGVVIGNNSSAGITGYRLFRIDGEGWKLLSAPTSIGQGKYFVPVSPRVVSYAFIAEALGQFSRPLGLFSNTIVDLFGTTSESGRAVVVGRDSDGADSGSFGNGGGQQAMETLSYVNKSPVKFSFQDTDAVVGNGAGSTGIVSSTGRGLVNL